MKIDELLDELDKVTKSELNTLYLKLTDKIASVRKKINTIEQDYLEDTIYYGQQEKDKLVEIYNLMDQVENMLKI